ncbi:hypothetical protein V1477_001084 [Vespula maculifrons]|uniref:Uncharacterized protein n=1 Tax=Vespula maculifrons TaxID=7453 RepID=A0ABD2D0T2_VESMC
MNTGPTIESGEDSKKKRRKRICGSGEERKGKERNSEKSRRFVRLFNDKYNKPYYLIALFTDGDYMSYWTLKLVVKKDVDNLKFVRRERTK